MTFIFVSGKSSDSTEKGPVMWARVKGAAENVVLRLFPKGYAFRPGVIEPMHGITSRTRAYRIGYLIVRPLMPLLRLWKSQVTSTEQIGRAMLAVAKHGLLQADPRERRHQQRGLRKRREGWVGVIPSEVEESARGHSERSRGICTLRPCARDNRIRLYPAWIRPYHSSRG